MKPHFVDQAWFVITRLWRFFALYFLKPFDAVNDTLTASLLRRLDWSGPVVEIGSGDGVFSYVMHGGSFPLWFDRYLLSDTSAKDDIYDYHRAGVIRTGNLPSSPELQVALDRKFSHVQKVAEINFARLPVVTAYEHLPFADGALEKVFYYIPHGLENEDQAMNEVVRVLRPGARLLVLRYDERFVGAFLCYRLSQKLPGRLGAYFARLDGGRYMELTALARSQHAWRKYFEGLGLRVVQQFSGLNGIAWRFYDTQTRPVLRGLIRLFAVFPNRVRILFKLLWMVVWYPFLLLFYLVNSREILRLSSGYDCYVAYELEKI